MSSSAFADCWRNAAREPSGHPGHAGAGLRGQAPAHRAARPGASSSAWQSGLSVKDLEPIIGKGNRVYEVLNRKRPLTLAMIRRLHHSLGIPAEVLIAPTEGG
jgi:hypothetical protein